MPDNLPRNPGTALDWIEARSDRWVEHAGAIGLPEGLAQDARAARLAADEAAAQARAATLAWRHAVGRAMDRTRAAIGAIKTHAAVTDDPGVYALALLSERSRPGEAPPPQTPSNLAWTVRTDGAVELRWDGGGPQGTYYVLRRALPGERDFAVLGTTTSRAFTDETLPAGAAGTRYAVTARHGDASAPGPVAQVRLGREPQTSSAERAA